MAKHKKKKLAIATNKLEERKERQRQWAINRKFEIRDYLYKLGRTKF